MQCVFTRWCMDPKGRTQVSVDPTRVDATEWYQDGFVHPVTGEEFPPCTKIIMKNKTEYLVQGPLDHVVTTLNMQVVIS